MQPVHEGALCGVAQHRLRRAAERGGDLVRLAQRVRGRGGRPFRDAVHVGQPRGVGGVHDAAEQGHADARAELVRGLADGRRAARLVGGGLAEHRLVGAEERALEAEAEQHEAQHEQPGAVRLVHRGQTEDGRGGEHEAQRDHHPGPDGLQHLGAGEPGGHRGEDQRQHPQPGLQRAQAEDELQVLDGYELEPDEGEHRQHDAAHGGAEGRAGEQPHVDERMLALALAPYEDDQQQDTDEDGAQRGRAEQRLAAADALDAEDDTEHAERRDDGADGVPGPVALAPGLRQQPASYQGHDRHHRNVDEEDRAPPEVLDEEAAEDRSDGCADGGHRAPHADGDRPLAPVGEDLAQDRQRGRHDHRAADAEQGAGDHQRLRVGGQRGGGRGRAEQAVPQQEDAPAAHPVAERAEEDEQGRRDQRIDVHDPQQFHRPGTQVLGDRRHRHVQDGGVQRDEQQADAEHDQYGPAVGAASSMPGNTRRPLAAGRGRPGHSRTSCHALAAACRGAGGAPAEPADGRVETSDYASRVT